MARETEAQERPRYESPDYRYGRWAGNERGHGQRYQDCVVEVWPQGQWIPRQCARKRGHGRGGLYCVQHGKDRRHAS